MKDESIYLRHMVDAMDRIADYISEGEEAFGASPMAQDAVIRNLEVLGEAAKRVTEEVRQSMPQVPWKRLAGLRDVLIHQYDGVDLGQVWRVAHEVLPALREELATML